jgi:hypothetical protein
MGLLRFRTRVFSMSIDKIEAVRHGFRWHRGIRITRCSQISRFSYTVEIDVSKHYALSGRMVSGWPIKAHRHRGKIIYNSAYQMFPVDVCVCVGAISESNR